jgi:hypothetical protein
MLRFDIDFEGVGDGFKMPSEGEKICKVKAITLKDGEKGKYLEWTLVIGVGEDKGTEVRHNTSLVPAALFNLRNTIIACGFDVPKTKFQVNTDLYIGKVVGIDLVHKKYKDKTTGEEKNGTSIKEIFKVKKTDKGWVRDVVAAKDTVLDAPTDKAPFNTDDDVEDIDI